MTVVARPQAGAWAARRTSRAAEWTSAALRDAKADTTVSVVLPARDEQDTVGGIVTAIRTALTGPPWPLVDELIVVDSRSTDGTAAVAAAAGARVIDQDRATAGLPRLDGKGDALWAGLAAATGDIVVFLDADLENFGPHFVTGLLGPLLTDPTVAFVKGYYRRPMGDEPHGGGRVTELVARPLLNLFWPELAGFAQPLAGEYAARREVLCRIPFVSGYGVELGMLIDLLGVVGLDALAQVDLGERRHRHQSVEALGRMSAQLVLTAWSRLQARGWAAPAAVPSALLTQFGADPAGPRVADVSIGARPPLATLRRLPGQAGPDVRRSR